jgi:hypothetical protein
METYVQVQIDARNLGCGWATRSYGDGEGESGEVSASPAKVSAADAIRNLRSRQRGSESAGDQASHARCGCGAAEATAQVP